MKVTFWVLQVLLATTTRLPDAVVRGERNASLKQLRIRLAAVKSIQRITKTMKMVAAAKLKGFQGRMFEVCLLNDRASCLLMMECSQDPSVTALKK